MLSSATVGQFTDQDVRNKQCFNLCQPSKLLIQTFLVFPTLTPTSPTMLPTPEQLEAFAPLEWAVPYLTSPDWDVRERTRGNDTSTDIFGRIAMRANDGISHWLELHLKPAPGKNLQRTVSLIKFGNGLNGHPGICHGGATLTIMDEALAYPMVVNEIAIHGEDLDSKHRAMWVAIEQGRPLAEVLTGWYATAKMDVKFLRPVPVPGLVGVETELLESTGNKMKMRAVMKDTKGTPLMQADGLYVKIGGAAKL
jgi:acyl-coenzyme A thioesterase PaaI-like protein